MVLFVKQCGGTWMARVVSSHFTSFCNLLWGYESHQHSFCSIEKCNCKISSYLSSWFVWSVQTTNGCSCITAVISYIDNSSNNEIYLDMIREFINFTPVRGVVIRSRIFCQLFQQRKEFTTQFSRSMLTNNRP